MNFILFLALPFLFISCGGSNTTGPAMRSNSFQEVESFERASDLKARISITSFVGSSVRIENFDLKVADLDQVAMIRDGKPETKEDQSKSIAFYIDDIENRLKLSRELLLTNISKAEIIVDAKQAQDLQGRWGWLEAGGSVTTFDELPSPRGSRVILKTEDKELIADLLTQKRLLGMWLDNTSVATKKIDNLASVQNLRLDQSYEYEVTPSITRAGFVRLNAFKRSYALQSYDRAIQYTEYLEPVGRGTLPRRVTQTCYLKMQKVVTSNEEKIELSEVVEFDTQPQMVDGWWYSEGSTHLRMKTNVDTELATTGLISWGSCHPSYEYNSTVPGSAQANIAARVVVKADVYFAP